MVCLRVFCNAKYILINVALAQNTDAGMYGLPLSASSPVIQRALSKGGKEAAKEKCSAQRLVMTAATP